MHSFEVHSNESACIKKGRLGLEQVLHNMKALHVREQRLGSKIVLWNHPRLELCQAVGGYFHASIHIETTPKITPRNTQETPTQPLLRTAKLIQRRCTRRHATV